MVGRQVPYGSQLPRLLRHRAPVAPSLPEVDRQSGSEAIRYSVTSKAGSRVACDHGAMLSTGVPLPNAGRASPPRQRALRILCYLMVESADSSGDPTDCWIAQARVGIRERL